MSESSWNKEQANLKNKTHDIQGGEKKVMKKSLKVLASATLAFSLFASVAMADTPATTTTTTTTAAAAVKTSKDFTDLAGLDAALLAKIDALLAKGYMDGKTDTSFDVQGNMTRAEAAKLVAKIFGLTVGTETASSFKDIDGTDASIAWSIPFIEAAKKAGIIDGMTDTTFAPKENVTLGQLATLLVKGFGKGADVKTTTPWYQGYLDVAKVAGVDLGTDGSKLATRADLVVGSFAASVAVDTAKSASITEVKAAGAKKITVTFNKAVDKAKAVITVKNGTNAVNATKTTFADDNKSVTLEYANNLAAAEYAVTVSGVSTADLTGKVTFTDEKVTKISYVNDKAPVVRGSNNLSIAVSYKVYNQYNEDVTANYAPGTTSGSSLIVSAGKGTFDASSTAGNLVFTVTSPSAYNVNDAVNVSIIHPATGVFASEVATVAAVAQADTVNIVKLYNNVDNTKVLAANTTTPGDFKLLITAKDQYGANVSSANLAADTIVTVGDSTIVNVAGGANSPTFGDTKDADGTSYISLALAGTTLKAGTTNITLMSRTTGKLSTFAVTVKDIVKADTVTLSAPSLAVAGEKFTIPFTAVDQFGAALTDATNLNNSVTVTTTIDTSVAGVTSGLTKKATFVQDYVKGTANLQIDATDYTAAQTIVVTAVTSTNKVAQITINLVAQATPKVVTGVTADIKKALLVGGTQSLIGSYVQVQDQYGRSITPTLGNTASTYHVTVTTGNASAVSLTPTVASTTYLDGTNTFTLNGLAKGNSDITLALTKGDGTVIANSAFTWTEQVVDKAAIASYDLADFGKLLQGGGSSYQLGVTVTGKLADGTVVSIPAGAANYTVSSAVYNTTTGKLDGTMGTVIAAGGADVTIPVVVTVIGNSGAVVLSKNVTKSIAGAAVASYTLVNNSSAATNASKLEGDGIISASAADINANLNAVVAGAVKTVDQYGIEWTTTEFGQVLPSNISNSHVVGGAGSTAVAAGDTLYVTVIDANNAKTLTFKVIAK